MQRRQLELQDFRAITADVEQLHRQGYTQVGNWNLSQVCEHIATAMRLSLEGFDFKAPWWMRTFLAPFLFRRVMRTKRIPEGVRVPKRILPMGQMDESAAMQALAAMVKRLETYQGEFQPHPFFGYLKPEQARQFHLIHAAHHLSFLIPNTSKGN